MIEIVQSDILYLLDIYFLPGLFIGLFCAVVIKPVIHLILQKMQKNGTLENILTILATVIVVMLVTAVIEVDFSFTTIIKHPAARFIEVSLGVSVIALLIVNNWALISSALWKIFRPKGVKVERDNESSD